MKKFLFFTVAFVFQACKKNSILETETKPSHSYGVESRSESFSRTVLGEKIDNPFLLSKMQEAENNVYGNEAKTLSATNLYVAFHPRNVEDIIALDEADIDYFDFPLGHEIVELGDIYQDTKGDAMPILYSVINASSSIPDVPYKTISLLYLNEDDKAIVAESFRLTKHFEELNSLNLKNINFPANSNTPLAAIPLCPDGETPVLVGPGQWDCISCSEGYHLEFSGGPFDYDCVPDAPGGGGTGCPTCITGNKKEPGGRVLVEDTQLSTPGNLCSYKPVRDVKVIILSRWGWPNSTRTDDNGCWKIHKKRNKRIWTQVKFSNNQCRIRATHKKNINVLWKWIVTHRSKFEKHTGSTFNNIDIAFDMWVDQGSNAHLNWGAATINNAVHEFHDYASAQGIAAPEKLDIYATRNRSDGYTLMHSQDELAQPLASAASSVLALIPFIRPFKPLIDLGLRGAILAYLPEVMIGIDHDHSDRLKETAYHELAHASHYENVNKSYWNKIVQGEVLALGYGDSNSLYAGRIALSESWANHIGKTFAHMNYGSSVSFTTFNSFSEWLEKERNEEQNHIPKGYFNDLVDGINVSESVGDGYWANESPGTLQDNVSGFTNSQMFSTLTPSVKSPADFTDKLIEEHLSATSNTESQVRDLFSFY